MDWKDEVSKKVYKENLSMYWQSQSTTLQTWIKIFKKISESKWVICFRLALLVTDDDSELKLLWVESEDESEVMLVSIDSDDEWELMLLSVESKDECELMVTAVRVFFPKGMGHGCLEKKWFLKKSGSQTGVGENMWVGEYQWIWELSSIECWL